MTGFRETNGGAVPQVETTLSYKDVLGTLRARIGFARNRYKIIPGLYCTGAPAADSPVLVTANYKLSFDALRKELENINAWILVLDTRGINVWCAAGKGTFSDDEIALQVERTNLRQIVSHRKLILPQFGATGVAAHTLKAKCGFTATYGPLRAEDIPAFLLKQNRADENMRSVTFSLKERLILVPVELLLPWKLYLIVIPALFLLSGISPTLFSIEDAITRGSLLTAATVTAVLGGTLLTPLLLPWIPVRQFWGKGALVGGLGAILFCLVQSGSITVLETSGIFFWMITVSSYMAMNFTGATPFTSLSGVEKEMRRGLPLQLMGLLIGVLLWVAGPFVS